MTIRVTTAPDAPASISSCVPNAQFTYGNHGSDYKPSWRRDYNTANKPTSSEVGAYSKQEADARVNAANENANSRLEKNKNGADIPNKDEFVKNLGFIEQKTGTSATTVISQKTATDSFARKDLYTEKNKVSVIKTPNKSASLEIGDEGWLALKNESTGDVKFTVDSSGNIKNGLVGIVAGGTGAKTAEQARVNLGLEETVKLAADAWSKSIVGSVGNGGTFASCKTPGIYSIGIEKPDSVSDFPKVNGSPIYSWGMMIVTRSQGCTSQFYMSHKGHMAVRQLWYPSKEYHEWFVQYSPENKPSATDIGALPITGGSLNGSISSSVMDNYRIEAGGYGVFLRLDGENFYILQTNKNDSKGSWNNFRPFSINMKTGKVLLDHETKINGNLLIGSTGTTIAQDGNIWGSRWGNKWLWDAVVELVNNRTNATKNTAQKEPNGWWKCGDTGIIYQWGITNRTLGEDYLDVRFPLQFPSACVSGIATPKYDYNLGRLDGNFSAYFYILDKTRCRISLDQSSTDWKVPVYWFAIGY
ncbi:gp53-like domain-containing protein [Xenorhabdus stockiae]|uniref:phage tail fiber protein n=1 Tax=Xenorhabdus stockiae TaxID=351614 RepID=UPI003CF97A18